jgi:hypothetical protein
MLYLLKEGYMFRHFILYRPDDGNVAETCSLLLTNITSILQTHLFVYIFLLCCVRRCYITIPPLYSYTAGWNSKKLKGAFLITGSSARNEEFLRISTATCDQHYS